MPASSRKIIAFLLCIMCFPFHHSTAQELPDPTDQTLIFWHPESGDRAVALEALIEQFNADNEWGITVESVSWPDRGRLYDQMLLQLVNPSAHILPNLVVTWNDEAALYALSGKILDLNLYLNDSATNNLAANSDVLPLVLTSTEPFTAARYALPWRGFTYLMAVNLDALAELNFTASPTTLAELGNMACVFHAQGGWSRGQFGPAYGFLVPNDSDFLNALIEAQGQPVFIPTPQPHFTYNTPAAQTVFSLLKLWYTDGCINGRTTSTDDLEAFARGNTLFYFGSSAALSLLRDRIATHFVTPFAWDVFPLVGTSTYSSQASMIAIVSHTPEADLAAWLFLQWLLDEAPQISWNQTALSFPLRPSSGEAVAQSLTNFPQWQSAWDIFRASPQLIPQIAGQDVIGVELEQAFRRILLPDSSPEAELTAFDTLANQILNAFAPRASIPSAE